MAIITSGKHNYQMDNTKYLDLIGRYLAGECEPAEAAELLEWAAAQPANRELFDELAQLWQMSSLYEEPPLQLEIEQAWGKLESKLPSSAADNGLPREEPGDASIIPLWRWSALLRYAAALALLLTAGYWLFRSFGSQDATQLVEWSTGPGEQQSYQLPDGSTVVLNENTRIAYLAPFEERRVQLTGEAFFEVARQNGKTFAIEAGGAATTVLGTSFNLRAYPEEEKVEVSVRSGKVAVEQIGKAEKKVLLQAGQAAVYHKKEETLQKLAAPNADAWKTQQLAFDLARLEEVLEALRRYFKAEINVTSPQLLNCRFQGEFIQPGGVKEVLEALAFTMDLELQERDGAYWLHGDASRCN
jgi:transmembrane sensor